jgi:hypothetical protein
MNNEQIARMLGMTPEEWDALSTEEVDARWREVWEGNPCNIYQTWGFGGCSTSAICGTRQHCFQKAAEMGLIRLPDQPTPEEHASSAQEAVDLGMQSYWSNPCNLHRHGPNATGLCTTTGVCGSRARCFERAKERCLVH